MPDYMKTLSALAYCSPVPNAAIEMQILLTAILVIIILFLFRLSLWQRPMLALPFGHIVDRDDGGIWYSNAIEDRISITIML